MKKLFCLSFLALSCFSFTSCSPTAGGELGEAKQVYSTLDNAKMYQLAELGVSFDFDETINPYNSAEINGYAFINDSEGQTYQVPMFYYVPYERHLSGDREYLTQNGEGQFRFRFVPRVDGEHSYFLNFVINGEVVRYPSNGDIKFNVKSGTADAYLGVSADNTHLEFDNGAPFVGIGHNLCGWEFAGVDNMKGTYEYERWMHELAFNGANMVQFDLCEGDNIEWTQVENELEYSDDYGGLAHFNQKMAFKTDYKISLADALGLYYRFTIFHWEDFDKESSNFPDWGWKRNPYNVLNGGPCETASDFFSNANAKAYTKNLLRYVVARWGYSTNMMFYELFNEVDSPDMAWGSGRDFYQDNNTIVQWHKEMGEYIKSLDCYEHMVSSSCANYTNGAQLWALECFDISTFHRYSMYNEGGLYHETVKSLNSLVKSRVFSTNKPTIPGEYAIAPAGDVQRENDKDGVCFHNALYTSILSEGFGTAMSWTWGSYVDEYDLYDHYKAVNRLFDGADLRNTTSFDNLSSGQSLNNIYYLGLKNNENIWLWIKDSYHDYNTVKDGYEPVKINEGKITVDGMKDGEYVLTFIDTYNDKVIKETVAIASNGNLEINYPAFYKDIAVKISHTSVSYKMAQLGANMPSSYIIQNSTSLTLYGGGSGIGSNSDSGIYAYRTIKGDFTYTVRLDKFNYGGMNASAGIMVRQDESSGSLMNFIGMENSHTIINLARDEFGAFAIKNTHEDPFELGVYLRVVRDGNKITSYISANNIDFEPMRESLIPFEEEVLVGVMACNINTWGYAKSKFNDIQLEVQ